MSLDYFVSPVGIIRIVANGEAVLEVTIPTSDEREKKRKNKWTEQTKEQLGEYFRGNRREFQLPLFWPLLNKSPFSRKIFEALLKIPFGSVLTYKDLTILAGYPQGFRAAGNCIGKNPYMIVVPCHRVLPSSGGVGGYALGSHVKRELLYLEGSISRG